MFPRKLTRQVICDIDNPIVETKAGKLRGVIVEDAYIFRGIRYAEADRFKMPKPVTPWEGVKDAIMFGPVCMEVATPIAHDAYNVPHFYFPQDENCQYLNVWTQSINDESKKRPVMVWIHGGGFASGSSVELYAYDGEELSAFGDVVVVSLNHRLNIIGYLDLSAYGEEYKYSGNVGMADIVEALKWIKENIAKFGGDPDNVTIMGQSGGGAKVASILQMPAFDGLYHKAVVQSGLAGGNRYIKQEDALAYTEKVVAELGLNKDTIKEIEKIPYYKLARAAAAAAGGRPNVGPVCDNDYFFGSAISTGFRKETLNIPVLCGSVFGEFSNNFNIELAPGHKNEWDEELKAKLRADMYGEVGDELVAEFKKAYPKRNDVDLLFIDRAERPGTRSYVSLRAKEEGAAPIYNWMFNLECPLNNGTAPWHNAEEAYMFHNACYLEASYIPGVSEWLQDMMTGAWVKFAETGCPDHPGMPFWKPVSADEIPTMLFDKDIELVIDHDKALFEKLPAVAVMGASRGNRRRSEDILGGGPRQST